MYIYPKKRRKSSLLRITILTVLILAGLWFVQQITEGKKWAHPFDPTPTPTLPAVAYINQGDIAFGEGQLQNALNAYETATELEPKNDVAYIKQVPLLIYLGDTARALTRAEQAMLRDPAKPENLAGYCEALDWEGHYGLAANACECAIELDPNYAPAYAYLAEVYADQADWVPARTTAQQALEVNFQSPEAHHNMGYALEVQGRYAEAIEFYENAITLRPKLAPFYLSAGQNYYWLGQFDKAADRFGQAIKLNPSSPVGYDQIGWTYYTNGEFVRAIDALEQAISVDATYAPAWGHLATIYYARQNYEEAIKTFPIAIELAEKQFLHKVREIEILTEIEGSTGPELVSVLRGRFEKEPNNTSTSDTLVANISPTEWVHSQSLKEGVKTCGELIAQNIQRPIVQVSPAQDITFSQAFSQTNGSARLDLTTGELTLSLNNVPLPQDIPYEVQIRYRPNKLESIGFVQPDAGKKIEAQFLIEGGSSAPLSYYYSLGLSYAYITPAQCDKAIPWLLIALEKEPAFYNPAWDGLRVCPSEDAPPTPLPTSTPLPEQTSS